MTVRGQTARVLALHFGLLPAAARATAAAELAADIEDRGHLTTGFLGTPYLLDVLSDHGRLDLAYRLLQREERPSWLYPITQGSTTVWERWDGWSPDDGFHPHPDNSFSHVSLGAVGDWMYRVAGGLAPDPAGPGFERVTVAPRPGGQLTWASTDLDTVRGPIHVGWRLEGDLLVDLALPVGATACVRLPATVPAASRLEQGDPSLAGRGPGGEWTVAGGRWQFAVPAAALVLG
jgi:alpha-L-rhamnosidase